MLCLITAIITSSIARNVVDAAVLPRKAPFKVEPMQGDLSISPTPLPIVSTYTLYFGSGGATTTAPLASQTASSSAPSSSVTSPAPPRSTSSVSQCSKKKHTSASSSGSLASSSVIGSQKSSSTTASAAQKHSTFPTVASASPTLSTGQRVSIKAEVLPHNFVNKVDTLVETYKGITGRKARQVALILSNQTSVVANTSRTDAILSNLADAYPSSSSTSKSAVVDKKAGLFDWTTTTLDSTASDAAAASVPKQYVVQAGRSNMTLLSNTQLYGPDQVRHDLHIIRRWAQDLDQLSERALLDETVAAIMSASARYYPELSTRDAARVIMADIKAESDFDPDNVSGGRLDSGSSWGLMQVSPFGSGELKLFQKHAMVTRNTYSWNEEYNVTTTPISAGAGPFSTGPRANSSTLPLFTNNDLFRPWINIHVATWIQSNLARTSSQDPYTWSEIYTKTNLARNTPTGAKSTAWIAVNQALVGAGLPRTYLTALGSWVAGPAVDGYGSYTQPGDDISKPYFSNIAQGLSVLYNATVQPSWLNTLTLRAGLIDYH